MGKTVKVSDEFKKNFKTEIYEFQGGFVACAVNRRNDEVKCSTKVLPSAEEACSYLESML